MHSSASLFGTNPPHKLKVYAPNGETREIVGSLCIRNHPDYDQLTELFIQHMDGTCEVIDKKVVVKNLQTGQVCYNPRTAWATYGPRAFIGGSMRRWLSKNPHWPAVLELEDNPAWEDHGTGINPNSGSESDDLPTGRGGP